MNNVYLPVLGIFLILASVALGVINAGGAGMPLGTGFRLAGVVLGPALIVAGFATNRPPRPGAQGLPPWVLGRSFVARRRRA